jgi:tripartite-type tricarboxylate transporter receptor subunit TctC
MRIRARRFWIGTFLVASSIASAQNYPARLVRIVVGTTAGSSMDIVARAVAQSLSKGWSQQVIVDNRPGATGNIGAELVAKSPADGHTLFFCPASLAATPVLHANLPFDVMRDFEPVTQVASRTEVVVVRPGNTAGSLKEMIALAKAKPGEIRFSTGGVGSASHMGMELFNLMAGIKMTHIAYKGGPQAMTDVINGQIEIYFGGPLVALPLIKAGRVKALGTSGRTRSAILPDVPTMAEAGVPGYEFDNWNGLFAPSGTSADVVNRIAGEVNRAARIPDLHEKFSAEGVELVGTSPAEFKAFFASEVKKWPKVVKAANIKAE